MKQGGKENMSPGLQGKFVPLQHAGQPCSQEQPPGNPLLSTSRGSCADLHAFLGRSESRGFTLVLGWKTELVLHKVYIGGHSTPSPALGEFQT